MLNPAVPIPLETFVPPPLGAHGLIEEPTQFGGWNLNALEFKSRPMIEWNSMIGAGHLQVRNSDNAFQFGTT